MLNNSRHELIDWYVKNRRPEEVTPIKLNTFIFMYETLSKCKGDTYDLSGMIGTPDGFVFQEVTDYFNTRKNSETQVKNDTSTKENY